MNIRNYIRSHLLDPLKLYPTVIQDTIIEMMTDRLEELYNYTWRFPEIVSPNSSRLDILNAIADQFLFTIREDADIEEQIAILENILYVYRKRGSIDTIENMWKYYGGDLPKNVEVVIPSYDLFRYSVSELSGTHKFIRGKSNSITVDTPAPEDIPLGTLVNIIGSSRNIITTGIDKGSFVIPLANTSGLSVGDKVSISGVYEGTIESVLGNETDSDRFINSPGVYEIRLTNNTYPIPDLKDFMIKELVAAGNKIYFTNSLHSEISNEIDNILLDYLLNGYEVSTNIHKTIDMEILKSHDRLTWSGYNPLSRRGESSAWSGETSIFIEISKIMPASVDIIDLSDYSIVDNLLSVTVSSLIKPAECIMSAWKPEITISTELSVYCTPKDAPINVATDFHDEFNYPGYFTLDDSKLGKVVF